MADNRLAQEQTTEAKKQTQVQHPGVYSSSNLSCNFWSLKPFLCCYTWNENVSRTYRGKSTNESKMQQDLRQRTRDHARLIPEAKIVKAPGKGTGTQSGPPSYWRQERHTGRPEVQVPRLCLWGGLLARSPQTPEPVPRDVRSSKGRYRFSPCTSISRVL